MAGTQAALKARAGQKGHRTILQRDGRLLGVDGEQSALVADLALAAEPQRGNARVRDGERRSISPQHAQGVWESAAEAVARYLISEIRLPLYGICAIAAGAGVGYPRSLSGRGAGSGMSLMRRQGKVVRKMYIGFRRMGFPLTRLRSQTVRHNFERFDRVTAVLVFW